MSALLYPRKAALGAGIVGGIVGGAVMYGVMSILMTAIGMGANCFAIIMGLITGQSYENALGPGITAHFLTSIVIGVAFGAIIGLKKFEIRGFGKAVGFGIVTGVIAYALIFVPIAATVLPPHMVDLMKMMPMEDMAMSDHMGNGNSMNSMDETQMNDSPKGEMGVLDHTDDETGMNKMDEEMKMEEMNKMIMEETQNMLPAIMIGSLVSHIAFGAALGLVVAPILRRVSTKAEV